MERRLLQLLGNISEHIKDELLLFSVLIVLVLTFVNVEWTVKLVIFAVYVVGSLTYTVYRVKNTPKLSPSEPKIYLDITKRVDRFLLEIVNTGDEDILGFKSKIQWRQKAGLQERELYSFIGENDDPVMAHSKDIKILKKGERVYACNIPLHSVDGKISVTVTGTGSNSNKPLLYERRVQNEKHENE